MFYQVQVPNGKGPVFETLEEAMREIENEINEDFIGSYDQDMEGRVYGIKAVVMTQEEYDTLPEFAGY